MPVKLKRKGAGLEIRTFQSKGGQNYLVLRTPKKAYHAFVEVEAKEAARECGAKSGGNTQVMWGALWRSGDA